MTAAILVYGGSETGKTRTASGAAGDTGLYSLCLEALCAAAPPPPQTAQVAGGRGRGGEDGGEEGDFEGDGGGSAGGGAGGGGGVSLHMSFCEVVNEVTPHLPARPRPRCLRQPPPLARPCPVPLPSPLHALASRHANKCSSCHTHLRGG